MKTLVGTLLQPQSPDQTIITPGAAIAIDDNGRIASVAKASAPAGAAGGVGGEGCWIIPGFIDAHLHLPQWDKRGIDGLSIADWQQRVGFPAEQRLADAKVARALAEACVGGLLAHGTTTVCAFGSAFPQEVDASFEVFARRGIRAIYGLTLSDSGVPADMLRDADEALDQSRALASKWHNKENGRLRYAFSPRSSIHCSDDLMRGAVALADLLKCHLQTHVADSTEELAEVHQRHPEHFDELELFVELGLLTPHTLLVHGAFLDQHQREDLAKTGTSLVHCPTANLFRVSGLSDTLALRASKIGVALGSSIGGGFDPFMPRIAVEAMQTAKAIRVHSVPRRSGATLAPSEAWWMLTAGGAAALGLGEQVGTLAPGYAADCLVVRPEKWIADLPAEQQASALLYTLTPGQIEHVFVAGKRVGPN